MVILGHAKPVFPYEYPALYSMPVSFIAIIFFSLTDRSATAVKDREAFDELYLDMYLGKSVKEEVTG